MFVTSTQDINRKSAKIFTNAIKQLANKPENLENLESYLAHHFDEWLEKFASTPENLAFEIDAFATMEITTI